MNSEFIQHCLEYVHVVNWVLVQVYEKLTVGNKNSFLVKSKLLSKIQLYRRSQIVTGLQRVELSGLTVLNGTFNG